MTRRRNGSRSKVVAARSSRTSWLGGTRELVPPSFFVAWMGHCDAAGKATAHPLCSSTTVQRDTPALQRRGGSAAGHRPAAVQRASSASESPKFTECAGDCRFAAAEGRRCAGREPAEPHQRCSHGPTRPGTKCPHREAALHRGRPSRRTKARARTSAARRPSVEQRIAGNAAGQSSSASLIAPRAGLRVVAPLVSRRARP